MCEVRDPPREFPTLGAGHPLQHMPMDAEHAQAWLNCPFAADCCAIVGGWPVFLHAPYVVPHSAYFKAYFGNKSMTQANRFMERFDAMPYPDIFRSVVDWMYTKRESTLPMRSTFAIFQVALYLSMQPEFFDMLHQRFIQDWKDRLDESVFLEDAFQAKGIPASVVDRVFADAQSNGVPLQGDEYLRVVLHWARHTEDVADADVALFKERLRSEMPRCTLAGLQREQAAQTKAFDLLVPPSAVAQLAATIPDGVRFECKTCERSFHSYEEAEKVMCKQKVFVHCVETFTSKKGNICCTGCNRRIQDTGCMHKFVEKRKHEELTLDGKYKLLRLA
uniref:BTB domain-containing protein n=1 Tax=Zooxanthella nutricula TaxID=1333877 RepID=A0A6U6MVP6_9DINO|mmetsp:Transcript_43511/g.131648  ORF Transcript_43511/g.131648 Transcript_43511/m.131648 type:complete len:334 (+) Transcript_43511:63-1064(+)